MLTTMPTAASPTPLAVSRKPARPGTERVLNAAELAEADQLGLRLANELAALVQEAPAVARTARTLAQHLGIDRNICQKILAAGQMNMTGVECLIRVPGTRSLYVLIEAAREKGFPKPVLKSLTLSVDRFAAFLAETTETQQGLREAVANAAAEAERGKNADPLDARRRLFEAGVDLLGQDTEAQIVIRFHRPSPENTDELESVLASATLGRRSYTGWPTLAYKRNTFSDKAVLHRGLPSDASVLLEEFSTPSLLVKMEPATDSLIYTIDPTLMKKNEIDVVTATRSSLFPHPRFQESPILFYCVHCTIPVRKVLIYDLLHHSIARECIGSFIASGWGATMGENPRREWYRRLPGIHALQVLGPASEAMDVPVEAWPRLGELTRYIFDLLGWRAEEFITHRAEVEYPVCGAYYTTMFDFSTHEPA